MNIQHCMIVTIKDFKTSNIVEENEKENEYSVMSLNSKQGKTVQVRKELERLIGNVMPNIDCINVESECTQICSFQKSVK